MTSVMKRAVGLLLLAMALAVAGCKPLSLRSDPAAEAAARAVYDDIAAGRAEAVRSRMAPEVAKTTMPAAILALRRLAPPAETAERRLISFETIFQPGVETLDLTYELQLRDEAVLYHVRLVRADKTQAWRLWGCGFNRASNAELAKGAFTLSGRTPFQLAFLAVAVLSPLFMLWAAVAAFRAPGLKRKWLWVPLSFLGVGVASINWTTGAAGFQPIHIVLLGATASKQGYANFYPWILKFTVPVGAVAVHLRAWKARRAVKVTAPPALDQAA